MYHLETNAPEVLQNTIKCFWYTSLNFGPQPSSFEIVPDGYAEIVFLFGSSCSIATPEGWHLLPSPFLMGLLNQPVQLSSKNHLEVIGIRCFPWTVFELLSLPPGKDGVHIFKHPIAGLQATLADWIQAGEIEKALDQVKQYFLTVHTRTAPDSTLVRAGAAMLEANGTLPVSQVASAAHATVRTLERKFKQAAGHTVKDVSSLMRFEQVRDHLWHDPATNLAGLAHELGYTDQAHLSREFKRFSGTTPAAFARKTRWAKKTLGNNLVAFVQA